MDTNKIQKTSNPKNENDKIVRQKPCFITSAALVFTNLHNAAVEQAAKKMGISANGKNINQFIINSGMSDDGRTISDPTVELNSKNRFAKDKFEVGIVLQYNQSLKLLDDPRKMRNEKMQLKHRIFEGLQEYFRWFAGKDSTNFSEEDLVEFIPAYNGGKVEVKNGEIVSAAESPSTGKEAEKAERIGYKIGYSIKF